MEATITIKIKDADKLDDDFENKTIPEMEEDIKNYLIDILDPNIGYDEIEVEID